MKKFHLMVLLIAMFAFMAIGCRTVNEGDASSWVKPPVTDVAETESLVQGYFVLENDVLSKSYQLTKLSDTEYVVYYANRGDEAVSVSVGYGWGTKAADTICGSATLPERGMYEVKLDLVSGVVSAAKMVGNYAVFSVEDDGILTSNQVLTRLTAKGGLQTLNIIVIAADGSFTIGNVPLTVLNFGDFGTYAAKIPGYNYLSL